MAGPRPPPGLPAFPSLRGLTKGSCVWDQVTRTSGGSMLLIRPCLSLGPGQTTAPKPELWGRKTQPWPEAMAKQAPSGPLRCPVWLYKEQRVYMPSSESFVLSLSREGSKAGEYFKREKKVYLQKGSRDPDFSKTPCPIKKSWRCLMLKPPQDDHVYT